MPAASSSRAAPTRGRAEVALGLAASVEGLRLQRDARHARLGELSPPNPMALEEAEDYVRGMLLRWVNDLM